MPLDLNQLAPVALWRYPYHPVDGSSCPSWSERRDDWIPGVTPEAHTALRTEKFSALVEELRAERARVALSPSTRAVLDAMCDGEGLTMAVIRHAALEIRAALSGGASNASRLDAASRDGGV